MKTLFIPLVGRFGNQLFCYAHARALAERDGYELCVGKWIGDEIFDIPKCRQVEKPEVVFQGYFQDQKSVIYTRKQLKGWFKFKPEIERMANAIPKDNILAHRRVGDYAGKDSLFPVISKLSYMKAAEKFGIAYTDLVWITEENPTAFKMFPPRWDFLADFIRLMRCGTLFRGNSTFSFWAGLLGNANVYAPVVKGQNLHGGKEHEVQFVKGNHPACSDFDFVTDLHIPEQ